MTGWLRRVADVITNVCYYNFVHSSCLFSRFSVWRLTVIFIVWLFATVLLQSNICHSLRRSHKTCAFFWYHVTIANSCTFFRGPAVNWNWLLANVHFALFLKPAILLIVVLYQAETYSCCVLQVDQSKVLDLVPEFRMNSKGTKFLVYRNIN